MKLYDKIYPAYVEFATEQERLDFINKYKEMIFHAPGFVALSSLKKIPLINKTGMLMSFMNYETLERFFNNLVDLGFSENKIYIPKNENDTPYTMDVSENPLPEWRENIFAPKSNCIYIKKSSLLKIENEIFDSLDNNKLTIEELTNQDEIVFHSFTVMLENDKGEEKRMDLSIDGNLVYGDRFSQTYAYKFQRVRTWMGEDGAESEIVFDYSKSPDEEEEISHKYVFYMFWGLNYFIKHLPMTYEVKETKRKETVSTGSGMNKKYATKIVLNKSYYFKEKTLTHKNIKHLFSCLCWGVRGHIRHYRNGKTVFISPYTKGKERNNLDLIKNKEYKIK